MGGTFAQQGHPQVQALKSHTNIRERTLRGLRQHQRGASVVAAMKERIAHHLFQGTHKLTDRGRSDIELFRSQGKALMARAGFKSPQCIEVNRQLHIR